MNIVFVSTMNIVPWGASEELWSQTALRLAAKGHHVGASVAHWSPLSPQVLALASHGIELGVRQPPRWNLLKNLLQRATGWTPRAADKEWVRDQRPDLVVISQGAITDGLDWMTYCHKAGLRYATIVNGNNEHLWLDDSTSRQMTKAYGAAERVCCMSRQNLQLLEWQAATPLPKGLIVANVNKLAELVEPLPWPSDDGIWKLAMVARLDPSVKGQDIVFRILAQPQWRNRQVELNLYGEGPMEHVLRNMAGRLQLPNVHFRGFEPEVAAIWRRNHLLVGASRFEGIPLTLVEAMACGRPVAMTDVGAVSEMCVEGVTGFISPAAAVGPLSEALERAWARRADWPAMGRAGRTRILQLVPADPVGDFCGLLENIVNGVNAKSRGPSSS